MALYVDASASQGMILRTGVGEVKHASTTQFRVQPAPRME